MAPLAASLPFRLRLAAEFSVSLLPAAQVTGPLRSRSPWVEFSSILVVARLRDRVSTWMVPPLARAVRWTSTLSALIFQVPLIPLLARVFTWVARFTSTSLPLTSTLPPCPGAFCALAASAPPTVTLPSPPSRTILPALPRRVLASMAPWLLTTEPSSELVALAVMITWPPSALSNPPFLTSASATAPLTWMSSSLLPSKFRVKSPPPPRATLPICAWIVPWLLTCAPSSAMLPPSAAVSRPRLDTSLVDVPENWNLPALKSASLMSWVDATRPPTLTWAVRPKSTPLGLTRNTLPFASMLPRISLPLVPSTRFKAIDVLPGWLKVTRSPRPTLKESQLVISLSVCWLIDMLLSPTCWISPDPSTTLPPVGSAWAGVMATAPSSASVEATTARAPADLPRRRVPSLATFQQPWDAFQTSA